MLVKLITGEPYNEYKTLYHVTRSGFPASHSEEAIEFFRVTFTEDWEAAKDSIDEDEWNDGGLITIMAAKGWEFSALVQEDFSVWY